MGRFKVETYHRNIDLQKSDNLLFNLMYTEYLQILFETSEEALGL